ncbi:MAG: hypothetical protein J6Q51_03925, partial [Clostridia bacterium]|nr:hypothetical protein [Clostridia bacterium]
MKFVTFLKIFAICFCSLIGAFAVGYGVMYITGAFNEPEILPDAIYFEQVEYNVDGNFTIKVLTDKADVTIKDLELSLITDSSVEEKDGRISDGVISIPKTAQIGEEISIILEKTENEIDGMAWITGGHSTIRARSVNAKKNEANTNCDSAQTKVNVDVPVYAVEVLTKVSEADSDSNKFAVNSQFKASLKFIPERSAYQFSYDGTKGYDKKLKTSYFILQSNNDTYISQEGTSNVFNALDVGTNSTIIGYCFKTSIIERNFLNLHQGKDEAALRSAILEELKNGSNKAEEERTAQTNSKTVEIVAVTVDSILANNELNIASVNIIHTIYANKNITETEDMSNLAIKLYSQIDESVSLQSQLGKVGIRFVAKDGERYVDAVTTAGFDVVSLEQGFYSKTIEVEVNGETVTYYLPNITDSIDNYNWKFAINKESELQLYVEVAYFNQDVMVCGPVYKSLGVKKVVSETITWNLTAAQRNVELKIDDNQDSSLIEYEEYDLKNVIQIPVKNLYKTTRFFAYTTSVLPGGKVLEDLIYVETAKTYMLNGQEYNLYELKDGVVKAKSVDAHGITFNVLFVTVRTNYKGEIEYVDPVEKIYKIDQYSKDIASLDNTVLPIRFTITKTLKNLTSYLEYNGVEEDFIYNKEDNSFAFVQGSVNPFDVVVSYGTAYNAEEDAIFKAAVESGDISIVVKTSEGLVTDFIKTSTTISDVKDERSFTRFTMNVGSLPVGNTFVNLNLYIRYIKTSTGEYIDVPVLLEFPDLNEYIHELLNPGAGDPGAGDPGAGDPGAGEPDPESVVVPAYIADFIEVYDGAAEVFRFNINHELEEEGKSATSQSNRIYVSSQIDVTGDGDTVRATYISTQYMIEGEAITSGLFVEVLGVPTTDVSIILKDKYGKTPISSRYQLESSDTTRMVVSGDAFTFTKTTGT